MKDRRISKGSARGREKGKRNNGKYDKGDARRRIERKVKWRTSWKDLERGSENEIRMKRESARFLQKGIDKEKRRKINYARVGNEEVRKARGKGKSGKKREAARDWQVGSEEGKGQEGSDGRKAEV